MEYRKKCTRIKSIFGQRHVFIPFFLPLSAPAGAMLILGGLMLNLVASGMLLRPINVKPVTHATAPATQKSPAVSLKSSSDREYTKSCSNGSSHLSNGISKSGSFPSLPPTAPHRDNGSKEEQPNQALLDPEVTRPVLNGLNANEAQHDPSGLHKSTTPDSLSEVNGNLSASTVAGVPSHAGTPSEPAVPQAKVLDFSLLKDPFFCIYTWSLVFSQLAYFIPYFHLSARARTLGIDAMDASFIISVAGTAHLNLAGFLIEPRPHGQSRRCPLRASPGLFYAVSLS